MTLVNAKPLKQPGHHTSSHVVKMNRFPLFSIVIPTYNRAALIERTLATIWQQTYPHYEVIVVDNCSEDRTEEVLTPYVKAGRIRFIKHGQNYERARSRNTGMRAAKGDFVTLLDSDDLMYPSNLEDAAKYVAANPGSKCFHNLYEFVDTNGKVVYRPRFSALTNQLKTIAQGNFMSCIGDFIHRDIYTKYAFSTDPTMIGGEDWEFWLRVLADYEVGRIQKINSGVVQHPDRSVNSQDLNALSQGLQQLIQNLRDDPHLAVVYRPYLKLIESSSMMYLATLSNSAKLHKQAIGYLWAAAKKNPRVVTGARFIRISQIATTGAIKGADV